MSAGFWRDRSVFVTGASGLLGSSMVPLLVERGANVTALIRDSVPGSPLLHEGWLDWITVVRGSITDGDLMRRALAEYSVQTVFHLGAQTLVGVAKTDPTGTLDTNIRGTWTVLEAARQTNVNEILVASSDKAYGPSDHLPYLETDPLQGRYPYDVSKSCTDLISTMYARTFDLPVSIVRCANLFGSGDLNLSRLIPGVIHATLRGEQFLIRSDGLFVRDFLYVEDAAEAYLTLAEHLNRSRTLAGEAFNFSLGLRITTLELTEKILAMMGRSDLRPIVQDTANIDIREQYLDTSKAKEVLGWTPRHGLEDGLRRTIEWYRRNGQMAAGCNSMTSVS